MGKNWPKSFIAVHWTRKHSRQ